MAILRATCESGADLRVAPDSALARALGIDARPFVVAGWTVAGGARAHALAPAAEGEAFGEMMLSKTKTKKKSSKRAGTKRPAPEGGLAQEAPAEKRARKAPAPVDNEEEVKKQERREGAGGDGGDDRSLANYPTDAMLAALRSLDKTEGWQEGDRQAEAAAELARCLADARPTRETVLRAAVSSLLLYSPRLAAALKAEGHKGYREWVERRQREERDV